VSTGDDDDAT